MSDPVQPDGLIPDKTRDLLPYLRAAFPEFSPRTPEQVPAALRRGAQRDLLDWIEQRLDETIGRPVAGATPMLAEDINPDVR